jgi:hypothetical protein
LIENGAFRWDQQHASEIASTAPVTGPKLVPFKRSAVAVLRKPVTTQAVEPFSDWLLVRCGVFRELVYDGVESLIPGRRSIN